MAGNSEQLTQDLEKIVGKDYVSTDLFERINYADTSLPYDVEEGDLPDIIVHPGKTYSPLEDFGLLKKACERHGMSLSLENGTSHPNNDVGNLRRLCKLLGVGMTLDVGHAYLSKQDVYDLSPIKDVLEHVHLHNVGSTDHIRLETGFISIPKVVDALKRIEYDKGIVLEVHNDPDFFEAIAESKKVLDLLWKKF